MRHKKLPEVSQRVVKVSIRNELVPWWEKIVEPFVARYYAGNRSAFIIDAAKEFIDRRNSVRKG